MKESMHVSKVSKKSVTTIAFYQHVLGLFTLSRKLNATLNSLRLSPQTTTKLDLILTDFSAHFVQLPLIIAEAETSDDLTKKIRAHYAAKNAMKCLSQSWVYLQSQEGVPSDWLQRVQVKMDSLRSSHASWSALITHSN